MRTGGVATDLEETEESVDCREESELEEVRLRLRMRLWTLVVGGGGEGGEDGKEMEFA